MPPSHSFRGFRPGARRLLRDLAEKQDRDWFVAHQREYDELVRAPLADLVEALDERFRYASVQLCGQPEKSLLPVSLDRRPGDKRPRYRKAAVAIMTTNGSRRSPSSLKIEIEAMGARISFGFHQVDRFDGLGAAAKSIDADALRWEGVERILASAGLAFDQPLISSIRQAAEGNARIDLMASGWLPAERFSAPAFVEDIAHLAVAANPFLQLGAEYFRDATGGRLDPGLNSLGI